MAKSKRHKWDKVIYYGKYSSFEREATCTVCGCRRKKLVYGYEYEPINGPLTYTAPPCVGS
jgi:hypothetical protein